MKVKWVCLFGAYAVGSIAPDVSKLAQRVQFSPKSRSGFLASRLLPFGFLRVSSGSSRFFSFPLGFFLGVPRLRSLN